MTEITKSGIMIVLILGWLYLLWRFPDNTWVVMGYGVLMGISWSDIFKDYSKPKHQGGKSE